MYAKLNGEIAYLWRAVDHEGEVLESLVTRKRDKSVALRFMKKALKRHDKPAIIVSNGLRYFAAMAELGNIERREMGQRQQSSGEFRDRSPQSEGELRLIRNKPQSLR